MGLVLRELSGDSKVGEGPIEVMLRVSDFNVIDINTAQGKQVVPATSLVAFTALSFRELMTDDDEPVGSDVWEFRVETPEGPQALMHVHGPDVLTVRARSKIA
jgi:hypothetical protein